MGPFKRHIPPPDDSDAGFDQAYVNQCQALLSDVAACIPRDGTILLEISGVTEPPQRLITLALQPRWTVGMPLIISHADCLAGAVLKDPEHRVKYWPEQGPFSKENLLSTPRTGPQSPRMYDAKAAVALPLRHDEQFVGVLTIESRAFTTFKDILIPDVPFAANKHLGRFWHTDLGRAVMKVSQHLSQSGAMAANTRAATFAWWMKQVEQRITHAQDPNRHRSFYDQILQVATRIPGKANLSGAILLLRHQEKTLLDPRWVNPPLSEAEKHDLIVVAHSVGALVSPPEPQWPLVNPGKGPYGSITGRVIATERSANVGDVSKDEDYISSGSSFVNGSELNCLLNSGDGVIGIIGTISVLSTDPYAFSDQLKEQLVQ